MMTALFLVALGILALIALPVLLALAITFLVIKLVLGLLLIPFRFMGWVVGGTLSAAALLVTGVIGAIVFGLLALLVLGVVILPLVPALLLAGMVYVVYRLLRPARIVTS